MIELLKIIAGVFGYITIGYIINKINIFPKKLTGYFDLLCFNVLLPLALICYFWQVTFPSVNSFGLMLSFSWEPRAGNPICTSWQHRWQPPLGCHHLSWGMVAGPRCIKTGAWRCCV